MPRRPRELVEGAVYHVYNRLAHGVEALARRKVAERFVSTLERVRDRDGLTILAWCVMSNHYHLAVRTGAVPLSRTMGFVQSRFGQDYNRRAGERGPLWATRYKAKLVRDGSYLARLVAYVHLNPVAAGIVTDPARYPLCGHGELLGTQPPRLIDVEGTLALFGDGLDAARRAYLRLLKRERESGWVGGEPGRLPWWSREHDTPIVAAPAGPLLDPLGRSGGRERRRIDAGGFFTRACSALAVDPELIMSPRRDRQVARVRYLVGGLAIERWGIRAGALAAVLGRRPEAVSRWAARAGALRLRDEAFRATYEELDATLAGERRART
jgi:REP element-mobilizing transposase RayT